jgi:hypothetical protein
MGKPTGEGCGGLRNRCGLREVGGRWWVEGGVSEKIQLWAGRTTGFVIRVLGSLKSHAFAVKSPVVPRLPGGHFLLDGAL